MRMHFRVEFAAKSDCHCRRLPEPSGLLDASPRHSRGESAFRSTQLVSTGLREQLSIAVFDARYLPA